MNSFKKLWRKLPRRRSFWIIAILICGALIEMGYAVRLAEHTILAPAPVVSAPAATNYGLSINLTDLSPADLETRLNDMQALGVGQLRYDVSWSSVQPTSAASYNWAIYDRVTKAARAHGFDVLMIVDFTPPWAQSTACNSSQMCPPADPAAFGVFAGSVANHYLSYGVTEYEIWNEPNISYRFHSGANPVLYTQMLQSSYVHIKQVSVKTTVIAGSMAPTATDEGDYAPLDFATALYAAGAHGYFDALSVHPYTYPVTPSQSSTASAWGQLSSIHNLMAASGDGDKKIWLTEFGAPTNGPDPGDHVTEATQAQILSEAVSILRTESWAGPLFWYEYGDTGTSTRTSENFYGLVRSDGTHKPAYDALHEAVLTQ